MKEAVAKGLTMHKVHVMLYILSNITYATGELIQVTNLPQNGKSGKNGTIKWHNGTRWY